MKFSLTVLILLVSLTSSLHAKSFAIDHRGSRPKSYRVTALCRRVDTGISPDVYKKTLFNKEGKDIKASSNGLALGVQDGKAVLLMRNWNAGEGAYDIIGDASNLDRMLPFDGVTLHGSRSWDEVSFLWHLHMKTSPGTNLARFTGTFFGYADAMERILAAVNSGGSSATPANMKVLVSFFVNYLDDLIDPNDHDTTPEGWVAKARADYTEPITAAAASATPAQRKALAQLNEEVLAGALDTLAYYEDGSQSWIPADEKKVIRTVVKEIRDLQQTLER